MTGARDWGFLLDQLCDQVQGIAHALVVTADGLKFAADQALPDDRVDQLSAFTSGLASLTTGAARLMSADPVEQVIDA